MGSQEVEEPHYNFDSDGEPPQDEVGDKLTVIHKRQVVKEIMEMARPNQNRSPNNEYVYNKKDRAFLKLKKSV